MKNDETLKLLSLISDLQRANHAYTAALTAIIDYAGDSVELQALLNTLTTSVARTMIDGSTVADC